MKLNQQIQTSPPPPQEQKNLNDTKLIARETYPIPDPRAYASGSVRKPAYSSLAVIRRRALGSRLDESKNFWLILCIIVIPMENILRWLNNLTLLNMMEKWLFIFPVSFALLRYQNASWAYSVYVCLHSNFYLVVSLHGYIHWRWE